MGVVNLTPNSFSDGGVFNDPSKVFQQIKYLLESGVEIIDLGAESTAPFNDPIRKDEELSRFNELFFKIEKLSELRGVSISIDSYNPSVFEKLAARLLGLFPESKIIWNDVSGVYDLETERILEKFPKIKYVYSHNFSPKREETSNHMDYVKNITGPELLNEIKLAFSQVLKKQFSGRIILDPAFGFSKNHEQNIFLLENIEKLIHQFPEGQSFLIGISRKSFLQGLTGLSGRSEKIVASEKKHISYLRKIMDKNVKGSLIFRIHGPDVIFKLS